VCLDWNERKELKNLRIGKPGRFQHGRGTGPGGIVPILLRGLAKWDPVWWKRRAIKGHWYSRKLEKKT